ncbi:MAG: STAS domain-containing protein [Rickettsiales bacterium]|nr:STAS domain-containing protein [Rickettsiales bacterium]
MEIEFHSDTTGLHARFCGRSSFGDYKEMEKLCLCIEQSQNPNKSIVIDLSRLDFVDSAGLGLLLLLKEHCERCQVRVSIANPQGQVRKMLEVSRLNELFGLPYQEKHRDTR